ncbi:MAG: ribonuclease P protein component [Desulfobacterales bacterium]|nr:ribonuclease P protein component [Desulfobacterales bacterium]
MTRNSFSKADRILKRHEYIRLSASGKRIYTTNFIAIYASGESDRTRLGITVTKKIGCAVVRNKIKRRVREYFRTNKDSFQGVLDINIIAKKGADALSPEASLSALGHLFSKVSLRR